MATQADVRRIALSLPDVVESDKDFAFFVLVKGKQKRLAWCWKERVVPKKPRVPNYSVLVVWVASLVDKDLMMSAEPEKYVVDPHYDGYATVLVRLAKVGVPELRALLVESRRCLVEPAKPRRK
jgi:hypothetical protein